MNLKRIEINGNYCVVTDAITGRVYYEVPSYEVVYSRRGDSDIILTSVGVRVFSSSIISTNKDSFVDSGDTPIDDIFDWLQENTGSESGLPQEVIDFIERVESDGGVVVSPECIGTLEGLLEMYPTASKVGVLYCQRPTPEDGLADFSLVRNFEASMINSSGELVFVNPNEPRISYEDGINSCPVLLVEDEAENLALHSQNHIVQNSFGWDTGLGNYSRTALPDVGSDKVTRATYIGGNGGTSYSVRARCFTHKIDFNGVSSTDVNATFRLKQGNTDYCMMNLTNYNIGVNATIIYKFSDSSINEVFSPLGVDARVINDVHYITMKLNQNEQSSNARMWSAPCDINGNIVDGNYFDVYSIQVEEGLNPTSLITTSSITSTRLADNYSTTTPNGVGSIVETINDIELPSVPISPSTTYTIPFGKINHIKMTS